MNTPMLTDRELAEIEKCVSDARERQSILGWADAGQCVPRLMADIRSLKSEIVILKAAAARATTDAKEETPWRRRHENPTA